MQQTLDLQEVEVLVEGAHMCAMMRGVKKGSTKMTTTRMLGRFKEDERLMLEFISHVYNRTIN
ncbi:MAG: GTP cyclohydrolase I [Anaerolineales bacterium]|nr:GTP cyclohydrolase I [Anaerolineales bacterium]